MKLLIKEYQSPLSIRETERAIKLIKDTFERKLAKELNLERISAPLFVPEDSGLNDNLSGVERAVSLDIRNDNGRKAEIVHSLAKWKRLALARYGFQPGEGIYTDMNAIRRDDDLDNIHSIYVDQWDWERVINREDRTIVFLENIVTKIVKAVADTLELVKEKYDYVDLEVRRDVFFITTQELEDMFPTMTGKERENAICREHKTVFLMQIGDVLKSGKKHDGRAPDYDDWALNGDILIYNPVLDSAFEISSMGIRVDATSLESQLKKSGCEERKNFPFHKGILEDKLPLTIGGGIGQSRLCMLMLEKLHIGEVQASIWPEEMHRICDENGIALL